MVLKNIALHGGRTPIVLLDKGWSCERVATALLLDDDTVRDWFRAYEIDGVEGLRRFGHEGSSSRLSAEQESALRAWVSARCPRSTRLIGAWLKSAYGLRYSRPGLIALLHRLGFDYRKPGKLPRGLSDAKQEAFIASYEKLLNAMDVDEAVVFVDAVHPVHQAKPVGCWVPKGVAVAVQQTTRDLAQGNGMGSRCAPNASLSSSPLRLTRAEHRQIPARRRDRSEDHAPACCDCGQVDAVRTPSSWPTRGPARPRPH